MVLERYIRVRASLDLDTVILSTGSQSILHVYIYATIPSAEYKHAPRWSLE